MTESRKGERAVLSHQEGETINRSVCHGAEASSQEMVLTAIGTVEVSFQLKQ